jgi:hypothetical protein
MSLACVSQSSSLCSDSPEPKQKIPRFDTDVLVFDTKVLAQQRVASEVDEDATAQSVMATWK